MGYLNNSSIVVDAILTRKGRELLAKGDNSFQITQFALADDEVDYDLYNTDHPLGSAYYGRTIEEMPITEAVPDETQSMKYKLVTLPKKTIRIPKVQIPNTQYTILPGQSVTIRPQTVNYTDGNTTYGYTAILADSDVCTVQVSEGPKASMSGQVQAYAISEMESGQSISVVGREFVVTAKGNILTDMSTIITFIGNETGGSATAYITVRKQTINTTPNVPLTGNPPISLP